MQKERYISCTTASSHPVIRVQIEKRDDNICLLTSVKSCFLLNDTKAITEQITKIFPLGGTRGYVMGGIIIRAQRGIVFEVVDSESGHISVIHDGCPVAV